MNEENENVIKDDEKNIYNILKKKYKREYR